MAIFGTAALAVHRAVGFREVGRDAMARFGRSQALLALELTREDYLARTVRKDL